jgi:hypothetical protein
MASTFDPTANLLNAVNQTDRDVLAAQLLQQQSNTDQTDSIKQSMNDISRYTNNTLEGINRDILNGKATTIDSIKENVNGNSRFTNDMISTIQGELLKGQYDTTITVKDQLTSLENNVEDHLGNMANVQSGQVADIKNNLYGIGKDIHTNAAGISSNIKDAIHAVDTSTMGLSAQLARDLNTHNDQIASRLAGAADTLGRDINGVRAATDAQFFNSADRIDRVNTDLKSSITNGFYMDAMIGKDTQREVASAVGSIERQASYNTMHLQKEIDHHQLYQQRHLSDFRRDFFEVAGHQDRHNANYHGVLRRDIVDSAYRVENELLRSKNQIEVQAAQNYANLQIEAFKNKEGLAAQAATNYAASQLQASTNTATIMSKLADCCCEIKETVLTTAAATQDTVKDSELASLRQQLAAEQTKSFVLQTVDKH